MLMRKVQQISEQSQKSEKCASGETWMMHGNQDHAFIYTHRADFFTLNLKNPLTILLPEATASGGLKDRPVLNGILAQP